MPLCRNALRLRLSGCSGREALPPRSGLQCTDQAQRRDHINLGTQTTRIERVHHAQQEPNARPAGHHRHGHCGRFAHYSSDRHPSADCEFQTETG